MNLSGIQAQLEKNKKPLAIGGAAVVAGLALRTRAKGGSAAASTSTVPVSTGTGGTTVAGTSSGQSFYDSTASDVYGAVSPQLSSINELVTQMKATQDKEVKLNHTRALKANAAAAAAKKEAELNHKRELAAQKERALEHQRALKANALAKKLSTIPVPKAPAKK